MFERLWNNLVLLHSARSWGRGDDYHDQGPASEKSLFRLLMDLEAFYRLRMRMNHPEVRLISGKVLKSRGAQLLQCQ